MMAVGVEMQYTPMPVTVQASDRCLLSDCQRTADSTSLCSVRDHARLVTSTTFCEAATATPATAACAVKEVVSRATPRTSFRHATAANRASFDSSSSALGKSAVASFLFSHMSVALNRMKMVQEATDTGGPGSPWARIASGSRWKRPVPRRRPWPMSSSAPATVTAMRDWGRERKEGGRAAPQMVAVVTKSAVRTLAILSDSTCSTVTQILAMTGMSTRRMGMVEQRRRAIVR
mmetsp:Transcript_8406/g.26845  ORF Transcript_8406/g.26845 Transcript_8406/m.26845 type:complete len:233 (+) Transcript_8406:288-986(+)